MAGLLESGDDLLRCRGTHARQQLEGAKCGKPILRVICPSKHRKQVFDVRCVQKLETAVLHVRNVSSGQLELQRIAMVRASKEHCLAFERDAALSGVEH